MIDMVDADDEDGNDVACRRAVLALWEDPAEMSARWDTLMASYRAQKDGSQQPTPQPPQATTSSVSTDNLLFAKNGSCPAVFSHRW